MASIEERLTALEDKDAIRELKHRYMRCVDRNDIEGLRGVFTEDARSWYTDGKWSFEGRDAILEFLGRRRRLSLHTAHHAEITLTGPATATAIWSLEDSVFYDDGTKLHGGGFYQDEYVKVDGRWYISSTGYDRTFEHIDKPTGTVTRGPRAWVTIDGRVLD